MSYECKDFDEICEKTCSFVNSLEGKYTAHDIFYTTLYTLILSMFLSTQEKERMKLEFEEFIDHLYQISKQTKNEDK